MNRRKFFKSLTIVAIAIVVAPKILLPEEKPKFRTYDCANGVKMTIAVDPRYDYPPIYSLKLRRGGQAIWIHKDEWDFMKKYYDEKGRR
jgi:hypothetical protein